MRLSEGADKKAGALASYAAVWAIAVVNMAVPVYWLRVATGMALLAFAPGWVLVNVVFARREFDRATRAAAAVCASLGVNGVVFLALHAIFGLVTPRLHVAGVLGALAAPLIYHVFRPERPPAPRSELGREWPIAIVAVVVAAVFRFSFLGYSEYQGDEAANCITNSIRVLQGVDDALFDQVLVAHRRPPAQIVIPSVSYLVTGAYDEGVTRFPFALAGVAAVWLLYALGRAMFGATAGLAAAFLAALNGYLIAFSRIVQYQSVVALALVLGAYLLWRFREEVSHYEERRFFLSFAAVWGFATLAHYESLIFAPVFVYVLSTKLRTRGMVQHAAMLAAGVALFLSIALLFYLPLWFHEAGASDAQYRQGRFDAALHFNWDVLVVSGGFYNSIPYLIVLGLLTVVAAIPPLGRAGWFVWVWFVSYFAFYMVLCRVPNTHIYTYFVPGFLLAGRGLSIMVSRLRRQGPKILLVVLAVGLLAVSITTSYHLCRQFLQHRPERGWLPSSKAAAKYGLFGFPYRRGWKTVACLVGARLRSDVTYCSNEKAKITTYYLRSDPRPIEQAKVYVRVARPQSWAPPTPAPPGFELIATVQTNGEDTIQVYRRGGSPRAPEVHDSRAYDDKFRQWRYVWR